MINIMTFSLDEQETSLAFMRGDNEVEIYSSDSTMITKLLKVTNNYEILTTDSNGRITSGKFLVNTSQLSFRKPAKPRTEAQEIAIKKANEARAKARATK